MSIEDAKTFVNLVKSDPDLQKKCQGKSFEDILKIASEYGHSFTQEEVKKVHELNAKELGKELSELSEEEFQRISGGIS